MKAKALRRLTLGLALAALGTVAMSGSANAALLQIVTQGGIALGQEVTGDPGGTSYPGPTAGGPGIPSQLGGWPVPATGFAPDLSFGDALGTSGYHTGYLELTQAADVTFQFMGAGNSALTNQFWVNGSLMFLDGTTTPCVVSGTTPSCGPGSQQTISLPAGLIPFQYITGNGVVLDNTGVGNGNPDPHDTNRNLPGYFLGVDPYLATGQFDTSGQAMYAGLSDLPAPGDHDFQDMGVRISAAVPEPGTLLLLGGGLMWLGAFRRRKA